MVIGHRRKLAIVLIQYEPPGRRSGYSDAARESPVETSRSSRAR